MGLFDNLYGKVVSVAMSAALAVTIVPVSALADTGNNLGGSIAAVVDTLLGVPAEHSYKLSFAPGAENASGEMADVEVVDAPDAKFTLPSCGYSFEGHSFAGWKIVDPAADAKRKANEEPLPDIIVPDCQEMTDFTYAELVVDADSIIRDLRPYASDGRITLTATWVDTVSAVETEETVAIDTAASESAEQNAVGTESRDTSAVPTEEPSVTDVVAPESEVQNTEETVDREASVENTSPVMPSDADPVMESAVDPLPLLSEPIGFDDVSIVKTDHTYDYTIVFNPGNTPQGAQIEGHMDDVVVNATPSSENTYVLDACAYTAEGYKFAGWSIGGIFGLFDTTVPDNQELVELSYTDGDGNPVELMHFADEKKVITLTATWKKDLSIEDFENDYGFAYLMVSDTEVKEGEKIVGSDTASVVMAKEGEKAQSVQEGLRDDDVPFAQDVSMNVDNGFAEPLYDSPEAAFKTLEKTSAENVKPDIVMIDTGAPYDCANLVGSVSFVDGESDTSDKNGHASSMADIICEQAPDATLYSIRVADDMGRIRFSAVYTALEYAISMQPKIISIPLTARGEGVRDVMGKLVDEATAKGIQVVGAAGNEGLDAPGSAPGGIASAIVVGACDDTGSKLPASNWGDTVDYYAVGLNTSEACSRVAGLLASGKELTEANGVYKLSVTENEAKSSVEAAEEEFKPATNSTGYTTIHRFQASGAHRFTTATEFWGWSRESDAWNAPSSSNTPIIESYNSGSVDFIYKPNAAQSGWENWGTGFYGSDSTNVPVYRLYNPNSGKHHYTADRVEYDAVIRAGWSGEGVKFYECEIYNQTVKVRYQNADGSWGGYSNVINSNYCDHSTCSWSRGQDGTYKAASISYTVTGANTKYVDVYRRTATNTIRARYQNADGSWGGYSNVSSGSNYVGQVRSWSRAADGTYQAASGSITGTASNQTKDVSVYRQNRYLDLNGTLDGTSSGNISGYGLANVVVGGATKATNVTDYYTSHLSGNSFSVTVTASEGRSVTAGGTVTAATASAPSKATISGTLGSSNYDARFTMVKNKYTIKYNANGGSGSMADTSGVVYETATNLRSNTFTRAGYTFAGWATSSGGSVAYSDGASVSKLASKYINNQSITLYAQWQANSYRQTVQVRYQQADGSWGNYENVIDENRDYGTTVSWSRDADATYQAASISYTVAGANTKYVDVYRKTATATVQYRLQNADGSYPTTYTTGSTATKCVGGSVSYTFNQTDTYQSKSGTATIAAASSATANPSNQTISLDVPRKTATATVYYRLQNADGSYPAEYATGASAVTLVGASTSYTRPQTATHREATQTATVAAAASAEGAPAAATAYLDVPRKTYSIVFDANGGSGSMESQTLLVGGMPTALTRNAYSKQGGTFMGWNTERDGSGTPYSDGQDVSALSDQDGGAVTLYAQWSSVWYEPGADPSDPSDNIAHEAGTFVVSIPKDVSFGEMPAGTLSATASYTINVMGLPATGSMLRVSATANGTLENVDVIAGDPSDVRFSVARGTETFTEAQARGDTNPDGSFSGTDATDTVTLTGSTASSGSWNGTIQYSCIVE